jgi:hypothetical protein
MPATQELLINVLVATTTIPRGQFCGDYKSVMIFLFLPGSRLMAFEAIYALARVHAHLIFVHDRVLGSEMTFRAFPSSPDQGGRWLLGLGSWSGTIDEERAQNQGESDDDSDEDGAKTHAAPQPELSSQLSIREETYLGTPESLADVVKDG